MLTSEQLDELERLEKAATALPWARTLDFTEGERRFLGFGVPPGDGRENRSLFETEAEGFDAAMAARLDMDFVVAARNSLPSLIAQCRNEIRWREMLWEWGQAQLAVSDIEQLVVRDQRIEPHQDAWHAAFDASHQASIPLRDEARRIANEQPTGE